eukprot:861721-Rhodomonas_salina.1
MCGTNDVGRACSYAMRGKPKHPGEDGGGHAADHVGPCGEYFGAALPACTTGLGCVCMYTHTYCVQTCIQTYMEVDIECPTCRHTHRVKMVIFTLWRSCG